MNTSFYQNIKLNILSLFHLSKDATHIYIGLFVLLLWVLILRKPLNSFITLVPVLLIAIVMELLDLIDDFNSLGYLRWSSSFHDIVNTLFWPFFIVLLFKLGFIKSK
jgi:hypothetical protein